MTIEKTVIDWLSELLTASVAPEIPEGPPAEYVVVEKRGQYEENGLMTASVDVLSCAGSMVRVIELDAEVRAAMKRLPELKNISRCALENSYNDANRALRQRQYRSEFEICFKED